MERVVKDISIRSVFNNFYVRAMPEILNWQGKDVLSPASCTDLLLGY
jgi:hypothetical protein